MSSEPTTTDINYEGGSMMVEKETARRGHLLCGRFCDMRIATVFGNSFNIAITLIGGLVKVALYQGVTPLENCFPAIVLSGIGIYGAMNFELWAVAMCAIGMVAAVVMDLVWRYWVGIVVGTLVLYPNCVLAYEMYKGVLSRETYEREEYIMSKSEFDREFVIVDDKYKAPNHTTPGSPVNTSTTAAPEV